MTAGRSLYPDGCSGCGRGIDCRLLGFYPIAYIDAVTKDFVLEMACGKTIIKTYVTGVTFERMNVPKLTQDFRALWDQDPITADSWSYSIMQYDLVKFVRCPPTVEWHIKSSGTEFL